MLEFPDDIDWVVSEQAQDLMKRLICAREVRWGGEGYCIFGHYLRYGVRELRYRIDNEG